MSGRRERGEVDEEALGEFAPLHATANAADLVATRRRRRLLLIGAIVAVCVVVLTVVIVVPVVVTQQRGGGDAPPIPSGPALRFVVLGDWGWQGQDHEKDVARAMGEVCESIHCNFVVITGDNFYPGGVTSVSDPQWDISFRNVFTAPSLQIPWYLTEGNHDFGNLIAQFEYRGDWRWNQPYYWYSHREVAKPSAPGANDGFAITFTFFFTSSLVPSYFNKPYGNITALREVDNTALLKFVNDNLQAVSQTDDWNFAVGHHPMYSADPTVEGLADMQRTILPLLLQHKADLYMSGHDHDLQHLVLDNGTPHILSGAGGEINPTLGAGDPKHVVWAELQNGFAVVTVRANEFSVDYYDTTPVVMHTFTRPRPSRH